MPGNVPDARNPKRLRIAIACPGVGLVQRGYERMFYDLFKVLEGEVDITLFKGGGPRSEREKVPIFPSRNGHVVKVLPVHLLIGRTPMHVECMAFGLALVPYLLNGRFDVVHCIDPPLARTLYTLRRLLGLRFKLLFTHGCSLAPSRYPPADHVQEVAKVTYDDAMQAGIASRAVTLVPVGLHPERFEVTRSKEELRREHGIAADTFVILSIAALNRSHKRTHHLIDEAARLQGNFLLWLDGSLDHGDPDLIEYARTRLGDRCRITHVPSARVGELYRMADVMAHAALFEAFGLSIVEASSVGLPVLVHDAPHFRWLLPNPEAWLDMYSPGVLAERLAFLMANRQRLDDVRCTEDTRRRFSWNLLWPEYKALYERVAILPAARQAGANRKYFQQLHG